MNQNQRNGAPVLARNCEIGCASFVSGDIPRNHSPPGFLEFSFSKFQETGGNDMYYDQKESGKRIAALRKEKGLTQEQLAEKCEVSRQAVTKWEKRRSKIKSCILPLYLYGNNDFMGRR